MKRLWFIPLFLILLACTIPAAIVSPTPTPTYTTTSTPTTTPAPTLTATPRILTATPTLVIPTETGPVFYTVKEGDTLAAIADNFGMDVYDLARTNHISDINFIIVGQVLLIAEPEPIKPPSPTVLEGKQIVVVLSTQQVYAFEDGELVKEFLVSTGLPQFPTVVGEYEVYIKLEETPMSGPGYYIPDVPWVMYFHLGYGFHGAYWHNNFGTPMSHGCVNMKVDEADWLFHWAPLHTPVLVLP